MKDFKDKFLYKLEEGTFETFVDEMLETNTEYNQSGRFRSGLVGEETGYFGSTDEDSAFGGFEGFDDFGGFGDDEDETFKDMYAGFDDEEEEEDFEIDPESEGESSSEYFPASPIDTSTADSFRKGLLDVFQSGQYTKGEMLQKRDEIVRYYAKYMPNNDEGISKWYNIEENSTEYDNIAYTIYKALVSIDGKFDMRNAVPNGDKLTVMEMKRTPLIYKITVKLPSFFKMNSITSKADNFNDMLKASDYDEEVGTILTTYGGDLVIKFLRLDYRKLVSMGDLLRLNSDDSQTSFAEKFATSSGIPMVAGMRDNEYPYMVDIVGNPASTIVGGSGSGKSWLTFQFMDSMLISNNPEHLNFLILDAKDATIWKQFALAPHVLGYHSDYNTFYDILLEVKAEHERRMVELSRLGIESWKDYTSRAKREGDDEKLAEMPMLFVIVDEITHTMSSLQMEDDALYKKLKSILTQLSTVIRASGIRIMLIGQRAIDTSIPKGFMANSPLKIAMKMNVQSDYTTMLGKGYDREVSRIPIVPGDGIMQSEGQTKPSYVKTVIPCGKDDGDILMQVRVLALDWVRRTQGTRYDYTTLFNDMSSTINTGFNRGMYYNQALGAIEEGRITDPVRVDEEYESEMEFNEDYDEPEETIQEETSSLDEFGWDSILDEPEYEDEPVIEEE